MRLDERGGNQASLGVDLDGAALGQGGRDSRDAVAANGNVDRPVESRRTRVPDDQIHATSPGAPTVYRPREIERTMVRLAVD
jgi:hypothetical protein